MSNLASTSRSRLASHKEAAFGIVNNTGIPKRKRFTGESLDFNLTKSESEEIRDDRQLDGATTTDATATGGVNIHMQYQEYDDWFSGLFMNPFDVYGVAGVGATFTADFTTTTITASAPTSGASDFSTLSLGQWFKLIAPTSPNNGKFFRVSTVVPPTSTVITLHSSTPAQAGTAITLCTVNSSRITNGVAESSFTLEKSFTDVGQFHTFRGQYVSQFQMQFSAGSLTSGSFNFMGRDMIRGTGTALPAAPADSMAFAIQNGVRGVSQLWEGGAPMTDVFVKTMSMNYDNTLRAQTALGNLGAVGIGVGDAKVSGSLEVYFKNGDLFDKFLNDTYTSINLGTQDTAGNAYFMYLPRVMLMSAKVSSGSKNQDVMASFEYTAYRDSDNAVEANRQTIFMDRCGAAAVVV